MGARTRSWCRSTALPRLVAGGKQSHSSVRGGAPSRRHAADWSRRSCDGAVCARDRTFPPARRRTYIRLSLINPLLSSSIITVDAAHSARDDAAVLEASLRCEHDAEESRSLLARRPRLHPRAHDPPAMHPEITGLSRACQLSPSSGTVRRHLTTVSLEGAVSPGGKTREKAIFTPSTQITLCLFPDFSALNHVISCWRLSGPAHQLQMGADSRRAAARST